MNSYRLIITSILHNNSENQLAVEKFRKEIESETQLDSNDSNSIRKRTKIKGFREIEVSHHPQIEENQIETSNTDSLPHSPLSFSLTKKKPDRMRLRTRMKYKKKSGETSKYLWEDLERVTMLDPLK